MEQSKIWRNKAQPGIELLSANYTKFEFSKHWHDELAIGVIEEGAEGLLYRGQNLVVPRHHIVALNPAEMHTGFAGAPQGWRYRMFYFDLPFLAKQFDDASLFLDPVISQPVIDDKQLFLDLLNLHYSLEVSSFDMTKESLLLTAIEKLFMRYGSIKSIEGTDFIDIHSVYCAREYIHDNWQENLSLADLEPVTQCTKFQLIRSFKSAFGITPHQYLLQIKAQKAKQLLSQGMSCLDTALTCGFYDQSHFNRNFKRAFGVSPLNYVCN